MSNTEAVRIVSIALADYDDLITDMALDPQQSSTMGSVTHRRWNQLVSPGSVLNEEVWARMVLDPAEARTRLLPSSDGVSHRHHLVKVTASNDSSIHFDWCGYSPGIRVEAETGNVVDDDVASMSGVGHIIRSQEGNNSDNDARTSSAWIFDDLSHSEMTILAPGSADPCT